MTGSFKEEKKQFNKKINEKKIEKKKKDSTPERSEMTFENF